MPLLAQALTKLGKVIVPLVRWFCRIAMYCQKVVVPTMEGWLTCWCLMIV